MKVVSHMTELRKRRLALDLTQQDIATLLGVSKAHVSMLERGGCWPGKDVQLRLERLFGIPASQLLAMGEEAKSA
jgi:transcriptional regulator with XRE-family HTH domain